MKKVKKFSMGFIGLIICVCLVACGETESESTPIVLPMEPIKEEITELPADEDANDNKSDENEDENVKDIAALEAEENPVEKTEILEENTESEITESISGRIESVENNGFSISKTMIIQAENGGQVAVETKIEADKQIIKVTYTNSTKFVVCTSTDGITGEYTDGSADDLKIGKSANLEGTYKDAEFVAQKVTINYF